MAYPAPPTPATGVIPLPTPIITYLQKYQGQGDALAGRYQEFLALYAPDSSRTHAQLEARILSMTAEVPKVFLGLVEHAGVTSSITLHRPTKYASHPVDTSVWDGAMLAFAGDVLAHRDRPCTHECIRSGTQQQRAHHRRASGAAGGTTRRGAIWIRSPSRSGIWCPSRLPMCILSWTGLSTHGRSGSKWEEPSSTMDVKRSARNC